MFNVIIVIKFLFGHPSSKCLYPQWKLVVCVTRILYIFIPKMHLEKHNTKALHHLILPAHGNSHSKIEYSLVSNIYSTPISFFSKWVWIGTRVNYFCISEFAPKMDELEFSLPILKLPGGPSTSKLQTLFLNAQYYPNIFGWLWLLWSTAMDDWTKRVSVCDYIARGK